MPRTVANNAYVCGKLTFSNIQRNFTVLVKKWYFEDFGYPVLRQDKYWSLHNVFGAFLVTVWANRIYH